MRTTAEASDRGLGIATVNKRVADYERDHASDGAEVSIFLLRNYTIEPLVSFLKYYCYRESLRPSIEVGSYDSIENELLSGDGALQRSRPDVVLVSLHASSEELASPVTVQRFSDKMASILAAIRTFVQSSASLVVVTTIVTPVYEVDGIGALPSDTLVGRVEKINASIKEFATDCPGRVFVVDADRLVRRSGWEQAIDVRSEMRFKAPFRSGHLEAMAREIMRVVYALKGKSRKCVILDCDNTLWGGIIGDDGLEGIKLDPVTYPGCAYYAFQQNLLRLKERGVLLALCSKNEEENALEVFDRHPHAVLRRTDFAAIMINWERKSRNVAAIAARLNLLPEALLFVDDNEAELDEVVQSIPGVLPVRVPHAEIHQLPSILSDLPQLDQLHVSQEDRTRNSFFQQEHGRESIRAHFVDQADYLRALEIRATIHRATAPELSRIAQLTQKTNQFNLTTRRYSESEIAAMARSSTSAIFSLSARDKFGEYGLTGVLIARRTGDHAVVDTMLMSCRVLSRQLEYALVRYAIHEVANSWGIRSWQAEYVPTAKNKMVADFWTDVGFREELMTPERREYALDLDLSDVRDTNFILINDD